MKFEVTKDDIKKVLTSNERIMKVIREEATDREELEVILDGVARLVSCDIKLSRVPSNGKEMDIFVNNNWEGSVRPSEHSKRGYQFLLYEEM